MHEAVDALTPTDNRNPLAPHLIAHVALARVPGAGAVKESVAQRDELDSRRRRRARFQFQIGASVGLDSRRCAGDERDCLVCEPRAVLVPPARRECGSSKCFILWGYAIRPATPRAFGCACSKSFGFLIGLIAYFMTDLRGDSKLALRHADAPVRESRAVR